MSLWLRRRDLRRHLYIATVIKFLATYVYIFLISFLIFLLDFIIVTINLIQLLAAILIRINYLSIYLSINAFASASAFQDMKGILILAVFLFINLLLGKPGSSLFLLKWVVRLLWIKLIDKWQIEITGAETRDLRSDEVRLMHVRRKSCVHKWCI